MSEGRPKDVFKSKKEYKMKEQIKQKLDKLALDILHCADDVLGTDLSADQRGKIISAKSDVLSAFAKLRQIIENSVK